MPVRRLLALGTQIAEGLAKAHGAGIVHRDLKPENVMVSKDGFVKILDFGLAKLAEPDSGGVSAMPTLARPETRPGVVLGTVGYMSPEQASGEPLDYRSDQFSLGSMLYEMATGQKAFWKKTAAETMSAIIREDPEPAGKVRPDLPPPLRWILERCLAKEPDERYASTRDLARELGAMRDHISEVSGGIEGAATPVRSRRRVLRLATAAALLAVGAAAGWLGRSPRTASSAPPTFKRLTFRQGGLHNARISPDGQTVYYGASWEGEPSRLYVTRTDSPESRALDFPPNTDILAVSSTGVLAINLDERPAGGILATVPLAGGVPRQLLERVLYASADFSPDGRDLAVVHALEGKYRLEFPVGRVILEDPKHVPLHPRISPKGDLIAFWEDGPPSAVNVISSTGKEKKTLSAGWSHFAGPACWRPDGEEIWFTAGLPGEQGALWAVDRVGKQRLVARVPGSLELNDISRDGRVLLAHHTILVSLRGLGPAASAERDLSWLDVSMPSDLSADGRTLLLTELGEGSGGTPVIYLRGTDGSSAVRLGEGVGLALSPNGKNVLAKLGPGRGKPASLMRMPTGAGAVETLKTGSFETFGWAAFLSDGRRIVFSAAGSNGVSRIYVLDPSAGPPRSIGPEGASLWQYANAVSPDGRYLIGRLPSPEGPGLPVLIPIDGGESRAIPDWKSGWPVQWTADARSIYVSSTRPPQWEVQIVNAETGKAKLWKELPPTMPVGTFPRRFRVTPDGKAYVYTIPRVFSSLYLTEGLR
jgi:Tol biopolymer transport system component